MDWTPIEHAGIALAVTGIGSLVGFTDIAAAIAITAFCVREGEQAFNRWGNAYGGGKRTNTPWWGWADYRVWDLGSILDFAFPCVAVALCLGLHHYFR